MGYLSKGLCHIEGIHEKHYFIITVLTQRSDSWIFDLSPENFSKARSCYLFEVIHCLLLGFLEAQKESLPQPSYQPCLISISFRDLKVKILNWGGQA